MPIYLTQAFRPFFPLAALYTAVSVLVWLGGLSGAVPLLPNATLWHAHEMLLGFATAVIAGFVLTAAANWTGQKTTTPASLALLVVIWLCARVTALVPDVEWQRFSAVFDSGVLPLLAAMMTRVLLRSGNRRNYMFIPFLWGLALINLGFHWSLRHQQIDQARQLITLTAWLVGFLMVFMGGRVIPFFSANRLQYTPLQWPWLNWLSTLSALLAGVLVVALPLTIWAGVAAAIAGASALLRLLLWQPWRTVREPMLWILHVGYAWLVAAYGVAALLHLGWLHSPLTLPIHILMAGGLGCLGLGMMTRVALGHSGRPIVAGRWLVFAFIAVVAAGVLRVGSYAVWPLGGISGWSGSAMLWAGAFSIYFLALAPLLWRKA
ncbi:NnrS family protein [Sinimarinibacterium sp. CAU 1509]|uniref:NnrS family protein n=1 Tax=Sinimarinibacterium sp. CAU 1509 TaxID=2562283 RepID=UPI00146CC4EE|nr:NnrS family protein [Sinimarinibacterium sp. CAU 1509]